MKRKQQIQFEVRNPKKIHSVLTQKVRVFSTRKGLVIPLNLQSDFFLCLFEAIQNAFEHAMAKKVKVKIAKSGNRLKAKVYDEGKDGRLSFRKQFSSRKERGRGLQIIRHLMDQVSYVREGKKNCLVFQKKILPVSRRFQLHELLNEISRKLTEAPNLGKIYEVILNKLLELFNATRASIMMYDPTEGVLKVVAARGIPANTLKKIKVKKGEGISGNVFLKSKPVLIKNILKELKKTSRKKNHYSTHSFVSAPMIFSPYKIGEETLGVINLTDRLDGSEFNRSDLRMLSLLANQAAAYIKIGFLIEKLKKR